MHTPSLAVVEQVTMARGAFFSHPNVLNHTPQETPIQVGRQGMGSCIGQSCGGGVIFFFERVTHSVYRGKCGSCAATFWRCLCDKSYVQSLANGHNLRTNRGATD